MAVNQTSRHTERTGRLRHVAVAFGKHAHDRLALGVARRDRQRRRGRRTRRRGVHPGAVHGPAAIARTPFAALHNVRPFGRYIVCSLPCVDIAASASSNSRLRRRAPCTRLTVTGSNTAGRAGSGWVRRQRDQDWITASLTTPDGRAPSSKKRRRASANRCSGEA